MFCSGCGQALMQGQGICPQCGRPAAPVVPPVPGLGFQLQNYAGKVKALSVVWFIYAGFYLLRGVAKLTFAKKFLFGDFGPWSHGPWAHGPLPPEFFAGVLGFGWVILFVKTGLALIAAWGLLEREQWGRVVAIVAGFVFLVNIPFGTALGIWTLVMLLGYRNSTLYDQL
jgi:hypothetical protein